MTVEVHFNNGECKEFGKATVKANGWLKCMPEGNGTELHYPPHKIEAVAGEVFYQSPHGRI